MDNSEEMKKLAETTEPVKEEIKTEEKTPTEITIKDLIEKAKTQYAWYVNQYPKHLQDSVARNLLQLEMNNVVSCYSCGIPSGMSGLTMRTVKIKGENGKKQKISLCPKCMSEKIG